MSVSISGAVRRSAPPPRSTCRRHADGGASGDRRSRTPEASEMVKKMVTSKSKTTTVTYGVIGSSETQAPKTVPVKPSQRTINQKPQREPFWRRNKKRPPQNDPNEVLKAIS